MKNLERRIAGKHAEMSESVQLVQSREMESDMNFLRELKELKSEMFRAVGLPYKPDLNDGVLITAAPLYRLFRHPKWKKDLEQCWKKLEKGEYDWSHLVYGIWPGRVREK
jgi:hypothetical protein